MTDKPHGSQKKIIPKTNGISYDKYNNKNRKKGKNTKSWFNVGTITSIAGQYLGNLGGVLGNGTVIVNGKIIGGSKITKIRIQADGENWQEFDVPINIQIKGDVQEIQASNSSIIVEGNINQGGANTSNGKIEICGNVVGDCKTSNGPITVSGNVTGKCSTSNGKIMCCSKNGIKHSH